MTHRHADEMENEMKCQSLVQNFDSIAKLVVKFGNVIARLIPQSGQMDVELFEPV